MNTQERIESLKKLDKYLLHTENIADLFTHSTPCIYTHSLLQKIKEARFWCRSHKEDLEDSIAKFERCKKDISK